MRRLPAGLRFALLALAACAPPAAAPGDPTDDGGSAGDSGDGADGGGDDGVEEIEGRAAVGPWRRDAVSSPGSVTFTELHYQPLEGETEWLELHNPMVLDMDLSGWRLTGGIAWTFPEGTRLPAGGYLVVAADPSALDVAAQGPWSGRLDNDGERVTLQSASDRRIDSVAYAAAPNWTVLAEGSGFTLSKRDPDAASDVAEGWTASTTPGGTPGAANALDPHAPPAVLSLIAADAEWQVDAEGGPPPPGWTASDFDDVAWDRLQAPLYGGPAGALEDGTVWATADNYFALYAGAADGSGLRLLGSDADGGWSTVEEIPVTLSDDEHLFLAAWELTGDRTSPQMAIAELELADDAFGTDGAQWEWVLGAPGDNPQALPAGSPPDEATLAALIAEADRVGAWALPGVELPRSASPWGGAVGGAFTDVAHFIWADTFASDSVTNADDTYVLFRSIDAALPAPGNDRIAPVPTAVRLRRTFAFSADPSRAALWLDCAIDDGMAVYLNGVEVLRENLPAGDLDETTRARAAVDAAAPVSVELAADALRAGDNVLAVSVHQATAAVDEDFAFDCGLSATLSEADARPPLLLHEVPGAEDLDWVELVNVSGVDQDLGGWVLTTATGESTGPLSGTVAPGGLALVSPLDLDLASGDRLFLRRADGAVLADGVPVVEDLRARLSPEGAWGRPTEASPGADNPFELTEDVVINEILYHRAPTSEEGLPFAERDEEWLELFNRGDVPVELGGWTLNDAVAWTFPAGARLDPGAYLVVARDPDAVQADWPEADVLGGYDGRLGDGGDHIVLLDADGNPADAVRYFDGGRWPTAADGGGSSLELRDPWADNAAPGAWAASDESARAAWVDVSLRGPATPSVVGPDGVWNELILGLLDAGVVLIDDLRVVRDPDGAAEDLLVDGSFDGGTVGWRLRGTHRHSAVVPDPDDPSNPVLRLEATGPTGHMHNHAETTLTGPTGTGEVEIAFRARWVEGSNQLHSRLYFHRLPRTTLLPQPERAGTPGAENSRLEDNIGPTAGALSQDVAVPQPGEPVRISVALDDPDGVEAAVLWTAVDGDTFSATTMAEGEAGVFSATVPGQAAGAQVHFYVEATDALGATRFVPAAGPDSRALYAVQDGAGSTTGLHDLRILMTPGDVDWLHEDVHLMSNDLVGATVVYNDREVFHDVGVRLKGSQRGRPNPVRLGYGVRFRDDQPFRGSHTSVMIDRSEGVGFGQREVLLNLAMTRAGSVSGEHNDLVQLIAPRSTYTGPAELQLDRFTNRVLDAQFEEGSAGTRFEYELIYYPTTTDDGTPEGRKRPQPDRVVGSPITWLGSDPELWRWIFLIKNNARRDDYSAMQGLGALFSRSTEDLIAGAEDVIDVDQWLRAFAMSALAGVTDQYGGVGSQHNAQFYVRPSDGRVLFFPHDLDFYASSSLPLIDNDDLSRLLSHPPWERRFYAHLLDLIDTAYTTDHLAPWCDQLQALLPGQDFRGHCAFMDARADFALGGSSASILATFPEVDFEITTNGGADLTVSSEVVTLEGTGWVDIDRIAVGAGAPPLAPSWRDRQTWQVEVSLSEGENRVELVATDLRGQIVGEDAITIVRE